MKTLSSHTDGDKLYLTLSRPGMPDKRGQSISRSEAEKALADDELQDAFLNMPIRGKLRDPVFEALDRWVKKGETITITLIED
jgi:hypothetical protein